MFVGSAKEIKVNWDSPALQYTWAGVIVAIGIAITLSGFIFTQRWGEIKAQNDFTVATARYTAALDRAMAGNFDILNSINGFYAASNFVSRDEFKTFAGAFLHRQPGIQAFEWVPRVTAEKRDEYEARARRDGIADFAIKERNADGSLVAARERDAYFPVYYIVPHAGNERVMGFDLASDAARLSTLSKARITGQLAVSGRVRLVQETGDQFGFLAFLPIFRKDVPHDTPRQRRENLDGFALGVFRIGDLMETTSRSMSAPPAGLDIYLFDQGGVPGERFLYSRSSRAGAGASTPKSEDALRREVHTSNFLSVGDRQWEIVFQPVPGYFEPQAPWLAWGVLAAGFLFTGLLTAYMISAAGRESSIRTLVRQRTDELAASEDLTRTIVDTAADGIVAIDVSGIIETFNRAAQDIFGYSSPEVVGRNVKILMPAPYREEHDGYLQKYLRTHQANIIGNGRELVGLRKDGTTFPMQIVVSESRTQDEVRFTGIVRDITERVLAEEELRRSQELLSAAIENIADGFIMCDAQNRIVLFNSKFSRLYPKSRNAVLAGARFDDFLRTGAERGEYADALEDTEAWVAQRLSKGKKSDETFEQPLIGDRWVRIAVSRLPDGGWVGIHVDITELKQARHQADKANRAKSEFLSSMSHELRTPMNAVLGFAQLLEFNPKEPLTEQQDECVKNILKGGNHLLQLINEVLELAQIETGKLSLSIESVRPREAIIECRTLVQSLAEDRGIEIVITDEAVNLPPVSADYTRFKQIVLNLMSNAVKYNRDGGRVDVDGSKTPDGMARISVTDTGQGIAAEKHKELFEPFSRLGAEAGDIEGTGIGLTVTKRLTEAMGSCIGFESESGKGSTFWFDLPLARHAIEGAPTASEPEAATGEGLPLVGTILYVEDNPASLELMEMIVEGVPGLKLISARTAEEGLELARRHTPKLVVLDINLPGLDGYEALRCLRDCDRTRNIPVVALSASAMVGDVENGQAAGFAKYLTKPVEVDDLLTTIKEFLGEGS
ncbi:MAG: CHASE domain-containing protein [Rhodospirillales bacterium]|nr:CHASE domain-containing protein [Rhodospirillales bacterium]